MRRLVWGRMGLEGKRTWAEGNEYWEWEMVY
jgi:hypothetical protein